MDKKSSFYSQLSLTSKTAKPFLKWAGGKGQLLETLVSFFPEEIDTGKIEKYAEPFIGGGALFFYVAQNFPSIKRFFISDVNQELILAYTTIQRDVESLISYLLVLENHYHSLDIIAQKDFFYKTREDFNRQLLHTDFKTYQENWIVRTSIIIFLNHTCFNGLFRVNSRGEFNVPFGDYKNPVICDAENLRSISSILQQTEIEHGDFMVSQKFIDERTFVYFDPPYRPISQTANFTSYSRFDFRDDSQKRLAEYFHILAQIGAKLMLSNSDPKNENPSDNFFEDLYQQYHIERVSASRMINCDGNKRGKIKELVIMNY